MSASNTTMDTDALAVTCYGEGGIENSSFGFLAVPIEDCRLIEVERDKAREERDIARLEFEEISNERYEEIQKVLKERDEALSQIYQAECRAERFCQERDEAQNKLRLEKLFIYAKDGVVKCHTPDEIRGKEIQIALRGWKHTGTINPAKWIETMANGRRDPSDMLDEIQGL